MCTSFHHASNNLCNSLTLVAEKISSSYVDPEALTTFVACSLITINKQPGVRPIGIGEVTRHIVRKAIILIIGEEMKDVTGTFQLCTGQDAGCEAGVHSMRILNDDDKSEAVLCHRSAEYSQTLPVLCNHLDQHLILEQKPKLEDETKPGSRRREQQANKVVQLPGTTQGDPLHVGHVHLSHYVLIEYY